MKGSLLILSTSKEPVAVCLIYHVQLNPAGLICDRTSHRRACHNFRKIDNIDLLIASHLPICINNGAKKHFSRKLVIEHTFPCK